MTFAKSLLVHLLVLDIDLQKAGKKFSRPQQNLSMNDSSTKHTNNSRDRAKADNAKREGGLVSTAWKF